MTIDPIAPLVGPEAVEALRAAFTDYTVERTNEVLGTQGRAAQARGDVAGTSRALRTREPVATLLRLFVLGERVSLRDAAAALHPLDLADAGALLVRAGDGVEARIGVWPYGESSGPTWWAVSDFGSDVRPGPLAADHVLGIGQSSLTLAQSVVRRPVGRALDLGTGCGVQALHLSRHAASVTATDVSVRALRMAATTAALSGLDWELRVGSLLEPVEGARFDCVVANPPFVVSPGLGSADGGFDYRDSGMPGDALCAHLLGEVPRLLAPGGTASLLANWIVPADGAWGDRLAGWLGPDCDAWIWQREVADPGEYVAMWLRDAGEVPGTPRWRERYDSWAAWFDTAGIPAVGMGLVTLWNNAGRPPVVVCEDVAQAVEQPAGAHIPGWHERQRWLSRTDDLALLSTSLRCGDGVVRDVRQSASAEGWSTTSARLRQTLGMCWDVDVDDAVAGVVAACDGMRPLATVVGVLAAALGTDTAAVAEGVLPVVRDLVARAFLVPPDDDSALVGADGGPAG